MIFVMCNKVWLNIFAVYQVGGGRPYGDLAERLVRAAVTVPQKDSRLRPNAGQVQGSPVPLTLQPMNHVT